MLKRVSASLPIILYISLTKKCLVDDGWMLFGNNDGDQVAPTPSGHSQHPLQGIRDLMTRANSKHMKQALQGLITEMQAKVDVHDESEASERLITYQIFLEGTRI